MSSSSASIAYFPIPLHNSEMNTEQLTQHIENAINELLRQRGLEAIRVSANSRFLSDEVPIDSLDLAVLVTELQRVTGNDPFQAGFRNFRTVGELANLYAASLSGLASTSGI
jgi:acyl carrier protein